MDGPSGSGRAKGMVGERTGLSAEYALLVQAASPALRHPDGAGIVNVRWPLLLELANWHRLSSLLYSCLQRRIPEVEVPDGVVEELQKARLAAGGRNLVLRVEAHRVIGALTADGVPAMPLKGCALIASVYPDISLRPMTDLDLLVPSADLGRAEQVLKDLGYRIAHPKGADAPSAVETDHACAWFRRDNLVAIDLHWHIVDGPSRFDIDGYWARARPGAHDGFLQPAPEDLLLHVALHFSHDRVQRSAGALGQIADMAWIAHRWPIDWDALVERARSYRVGDPLFLALLATEALLGPIVPDTALAALQPSFYQPALGQKFVTQRVLRARPYLPLDHLWDLRGRLVLDRDDLVGYAAHGETVPGLARLYLRRVASLVRRGAPYLLRPRELALDLRLSRWLASLRS